MLNSEHKTIARAAPLVPAFSKLAAEEEAVSSAEKGNSAAYEGAPAASSSAAAALTRRRRGSTCSAITACTFGPQTSQQLPTVVEEHKAADGA